MDTTDITIAAFQDELEKISSGISRSFRRPISVDRLLERDSGNFVDEDWSEEKVSAPAKMDWVKPTALMVGGAGVYHVGRQANEDRKMGYRMRVGQGG